MMMYRSTNPVIIMAILLMSSMICLWSKSWYMIWVLMEINLMMFIYMITMEKKKEKILLFFIFQSMASMATLMFILMTKSMKMEENHSNSLMVISIAMMMKIGLYPFFGWAVEISKMMSWSTNLTLMTWQKIIPFFIFMKFFKKNMMTTILLTSMVFMTMIMMKLSNLKMMFMSSSLVHSSWAIIGLKYLNMMFLVYLTIYSMIIIVNVKTLKKNNDKSNPIINFLDKSKITMMANLMSMAGIPPLIGFFMKMMVIYALIKSTMSNITLMTMILMSTLSFYIYMQMLFKNFLASSNNTKKKIKKEKNNNMKNFSMNMILPLMMIM